MIYIDKYGDALRINPEHLSSITKSIPESDGVCEVRVETVTFCETKRVHLEYLKDRKTANIFIRWFVEQISMDVEWADWDEFSRQLEEEEEEDK